MSENYNLLDAIIFCTPFMKLIALCSGDDYIKYYVRAFLSKSALVKPNSVIEANSSPLTVAPMEFGQHRTSFRPPC